ncbi:MAG: hypothetical protein A2X08_07325 [Bacteroidetes bacterium GWA2_32_17]|nr:MAG: hypothetical protein A2X08_07325 [Bacteroidetes bacterium GWA2_32_17]
MKIEYIKNKNIDYKKWDACIQKSINGNLYACSWYLDIVCNNWDALIYNNYEAVMPLTFSSKMGILYLSQPLFTQQLGVFSTSAVSQNLLLEFFNNIPSTFKYIEINLNKYNILKSNKLVYRKNHNFELDLISNYKQIAKKYSENTKRNISKSVKFGLQPISNSCSVNDFVNFIKKNVGDKVANLPTEKYGVIRKIVSHSLKNGFGEIICAYNPQNELSSAAFFIFSQKKAIYLFAASTDEGKEKRAMFLIIDEFIKKYSEKNLILDFEGSNIDGLARFYKGFGAVYCEYMTIKQNRLPFPLKFLKK